MSADVAALAASLTYEEHMRFAYSPMVISFMAWHAAEQACAISKAERVAELKPLQREVARQKSEWLRFVGGSLSPKALFAVEKEAEKVEASCATLLFQFHMTLKERLMKDHPEADLTMLRSKAMLASVLVDFLQAYMRKADEEVSRKVPIEPSFLPAPMKSLRLLMNAMAGDCKPDMGSPELSLCWRVLETKINNIKYE